MECSRIARARKRKNKKIPEMSNDFWYFVFRKEDTY
jgi:hypothetical protein